MLKHVYDYFKIILVLLFCAGTQAQAQITRVFGKVFDPLTNEPVAFASVLFTGTGVGVTSDIDGKYSLETTLVVDSIRASFVGYLPASMKVTRGRTQEINFALRVNKFDLAEVEIKAGENPALILL